MCHSNLDMRQVQLSKAYGAYNVPVYFVTELIGIALGMSPKDLGINRHFIPAEATLTKSEKPVKAVKHSGKSRGIYLSLRFQHRCSC